MQAIKRAFEKILKCLDDTFGAWIRPNEASINELAGQLRHIGPQSIFYITMDYYFYYVIKFKMFDGAVFNAVSHIYLKLRHPDTGLLREVCAECCFYLKYAYGLTLKKIWSYMHYTSLGAPLLVFSFFFIKKTFFYKIIYKLTFLLMLFFFIFLIFNFLCNSIVYNKYISSYRRFWKKSLMSFWMVEFFLFFLVIFLTLNSPSEPMWIDPVKFIYKNKYTLFPFFVYTMLPLTISSSAIILTFLVKNKNLEKINVIMLISLAISLVVLYLEFLRVYYVLNLFRTNKPVRTVKNKNSKLFKQRRVNIFKRRTENFFFILASLIKFWHVFFIVVFYFFSLSRSLLLKKTSLDVLQATHINFLYISILNYVSYILFFKRFLYRYIRISYGFWYNNRELGVYSNEFIVLVKDVIGLADMLLSCTLIDLALSVDGFLGGVYGLTGSFVGHCAARLWVWLGTIKKDCDATISGLPQRFDDHFIAAAKKIVKWDEEAWEREVAIMATE